MKILGAATLAVALTGLMVPEVATPQTFAERFKQELEKEKAKRKGPGENNTAGHPTFAESEIAGYFAKYPQPGGGKKLQWPRMFVLIKDAPSWHLQRNGENKSFPGEGCWTFMARIWTSESEYRDTPDFYKCSSEDLHTYVGLTHSVGYMEWSGATDRFRLRARGETTTGTERTMGPVPPDTGLPNTPAYRNLKDRNYPTLTFALASTYTGAVVQELLRATQMDYTEGDDRLWVSLAPEISPDRAPVRMDAPAPPPTPAAGGTPVPAAGGNGVPAGYTESTIACDPKKFKSTIGICTVNGKVAVPTPKLPGQ